MSVEEIIKRTVEETVTKMKVAGMLKGNDKTAYQKTEDLLRNYNSLTVSGDPEVEQVVLQIESALRLINDDYYYDIIPMYYIQKRTREEIAERFNTSVTTISRNKNRLVNALSITLFSADYVRQLLS